MSIPISRFIPLLPFPPGNRRFVFSLLVFLSSELRHKLRASTPRPGKCPKLIPSQQLQGTLVTEIFPLAGWLPLRLAGTWDPWLQCLHLDKRLLKQQNTKKL